MFAPSREAARRFFFDAWRKYQERKVLSPLEDMAVRVILDHPEYHRLLGDWDACRDLDLGEANPFLHLSLHLAVEEQLAIDQPPGICAGCGRIAERLGTHHAARHAVIECLGEVLGKAQQTGSLPDGNQYRECVERKAGRGTPS